MAVRRWSPEPILGFGSAMLILLGLGSAVGIGNGVGVMIFWITMLTTFVVAVQACRTRQFATASIAIPSLIIGLLLWSLLAPIT